MLRIDEEKSKLEKKIEQMDNVNDIIKNHIYTILVIENMVIGRVSEIEAYYIAQSKNMVKILSSIKTFFKPSTGTKTK